MKPAAYVDTSRACGEAKRPTNTAGAEVPRMTAASEVLQRGNRLAQLALELAGRAEEVLMPVTRLSAGCEKESERLVPSYPALMAEIDSINDRVEYALLRIEDVLNRLEI